MRTTVVSLAIVLALALPVAAQPVPAPHSPGQSEATNCPHAASGRAAPSPAVIAARQTEHQACAADMRQFCANVPRGCGRPMQCLRAHTAALSPACTNAMAQLHAAREQSRHNTGGNPAAPSPSGR